MIFNSSSVGITRENRQIKLIHDLSRLALGLQQLAELRALFDLAPDMARIQQVQLLGGRGAIVALRFQTGVARRTAEHFQKRTADAAVGQFDRALVFGNEGERLGNRAGIFLRRAGDLADGVDQHLRFQPARRIVRKIGVALRIISLGNGGKLIGFRIQNQADRCASGRSGLQPIPAPDRPAIRDCSADCPGGCRPARE